MDKEEVNKRFNELPRKIRTTLIGVELSNEIDFLKREKKVIEDSHKLTIAKINERIFNLERHLKNLIDD